MALQHAFNLYTLFAKVGASRTLGFIDYSGGLRGHSALLDVVLHD